jgi:hypothetical protein
MEFVHAAKAQTTSKRRVPLACTPCRTRHLRCDGRRPCCDRCAEAEKQCEYAKSKRGGRSPKVPPDTFRHQTPVCYSSPAVSQTVCASQQIQAQVRTPAAQQGRSSSERLSCSVATSMSSSTQDLTADSITQDASITAYFKNFHRFHPIVVPRSHLIKLSKKSTYHSRLQPLLQVLQLIGAIYSSQQWSVELMGNIETCLQQASASDPFTVQSHLLFSIALFWHDLKDESQQHMYSAIRVARLLNMHLQSFAARYGDGDPVLAECWRRTWWMLYTADAYYVGTLGTGEFSFNDLEIGTDLPCEEHEYESDVCPE